MYTLEHNLKRFRSKERAEFENAIDREAEEKRMAPIRAAMAEQRQLLNDIQKIEREEIMAGRPDPSWPGLPESAQNLRMSVQQAREFAREESGKFVAEHPEYHRCRDNFEKITNYLSTNGVVIPNAECFHLAFERLRSLRLLTEKPEPAQITTPELQAPANIEFNPDDAESMQTAITKVESLLEPEKREAEQQRAYMEDAIYFDPVEPDRKFTAWQLDYDPSISAEKLRRILRIPRGPNTYTPRDGAMHR